MQITVSLMVDMPASADINEIEQRVQAAGWQAMRAATQQAVRAAEEQGRPARTAEVKRAVAKEPTDGSF